MIPPRDIPSSFSCEPGGSGTAQADGQPEQARRHPRSTRGRRSPTAPAGGDGIERRDVEPSEVAERLRGMLGLPPEQPAEGEAAASIRRSLPALVQGLDAGGWIAWCLVGLVIFDDRFPTLETIRHESKRFAGALAMLRARGNVTVAAGMLKASRKVLRDNLRVGGLYPWRVGPDEGTVKHTPRTAARFAAWLAVVGPVLERAKAHLISGATRTEAIERALREHPVPVELAEATRVAWWHTATSPNEKGDQGGRA